MSQTFYYHCAEYIKLDTCAKFHDHRNNNNKVVMGEAPPPLVKGVGTKRLGKGTVEVTYSQCLNRIVCDFRNAIIQKPKMLYTSNFLMKEIKDGTLISKKQNFKNESFKMGFNAPENQII